MNAGYCSGTECRDGDDKCTKPFVKSSEYKGLRGKMVKIIEIFVLWVAIRFNGAIYSSHAFQRVNGIEPMAVSFVLAQWHSVAIQMMCSR